MMHTEGKFGWRGREEERREEKRGRETSPRVIGRLVDGSVWAEGSESHRTGSAGAESDTTTTRASLAKK